MTTTTLSPAAHSAIAGPVVIAVMDGVGIGRGDSGDAVATAHTPHLDHYRQSPLSTQLLAHGRAVGLPSDKDMGNSEVGHNAIGGGKVVTQGAQLVSNAAADGSLFEGELWGEIVGRCTRNRSPLHLLGLLSDGNVHSHIDHVITIIRRANQDGIEALYVHALLDGRDVSKTSALKYIAELEAALAPINDRSNRSYRIASGGGRMVITMDRYEADWGMVEKGWHTHVLGEGRGFSSAGEAVETLRAEHPGIGDQDLPPFVITDPDGPVGRIEDGSAVVTFNFRGDRVLEITSAFEDKEFASFDRKRVPDVLYAGMMQYDGDTQRPKRYLVAPPVIRETMSELLCAQGISQLACSETQKFGHVTYFWNGNRSDYFDRSIERYVEIPSHRGAFDHHPEMKATEIVDSVLQELADGKFRFARLNLANGDMVGHTGNFEATCKAMEVVDNAMGKLVETVLRMNGAVIMTADHGNADDMVERDKATGQPLLDAQGRPIPRTSHSLNPVPFSVLLPSAGANKFRLRTATSPFTLGNIASSALTLLGYETPELYNPSIIQANSP